MIVDTSAVLAIILREPEREIFLQTMAAARHRRFSAGSWIELAAVATRSRRPRLIAAADEMFAAFRIEIVPVSVAQARLGHDAYVRYGAGSGHPARLNFGDCFAYALAGETGEALLFKGDDFAQTDVRAAV